MQVNQSTNTNFKARIVPTEYLKEGIRYAKDAKGICSNKADQFLSALKTIANDGTKDDVLIRGVKGSFMSPGQARLQEILRNGKVVYAPHTGHCTYIYDGPQCVEGIIDYARGLIKKQTGKWTKLESGNVYKKMQALAEKQKIEMEKMEAEFQADLSKQLDDLIK